MQKDKENTEYSVRPSLSTAKFLWGEQYASFRKNESFPDYHQEFDRFNDKNRSLASALVVYFVLSLMQFPTYIELCHHTTSTRRILCIISALGMISIFISMWTSFYYQWCTSINYNNAFTSCCRKWNTYIHAHIVLGSTIFYSLRLFMRVYSEDCDETTTSFLDRMNCTPKNDYGLPFESVLVLMLFPVMLAVIMREIDTRLLMLSWGGSLASLIVAMILASAFRYTVIILIYILPSAVILFETHRHNRSLFFMSHELTMSIRDRDQNADQIHATEMRHMIANVAHDLKTPLTSFLSGIELISEVALDCQKKISENDLNPVYLHENVISILKCITNIRNTNSFMLMTINRCIDYTKASKGLKLVPKCETIDLMETLSLPLNCMKDIQQRVSIQLQPIPKEICSHVITDKQWLQENVLCLLSNAVKYSSEGAVTVTVRLVAGDELDLECRQMDERLRKKGSGSGGSLPTSLLRRSLSRYMVVPVNSLIADRSNASMLVSSRDEGSVREQGSFRSGAGGGLRDNGSRDGRYEFLLRIEIEDCGIGLSEEAMSNLFNPFKQAQRLAGGTGLGLYSLARRLEALNGYYGVDHRRDGEQGCMFWFSIPYRPDKVSAGAIRRSIFPRRQDGLMSTIAAITEAAEKATLTSGDSAERSDARYPSNMTDPNDQQDVTPPSLALTPSNSQCAAAIIPPDFAIPSASRSTETGPCLDILVVDDSPAIVKMISMMLRRLGHTIVIAENGDVALKKIWERLEETKSPFDVVLMDLQMPVMDGLEATRRLRLFEASCPTSATGSFIRRSMMSRRSSASRQTTPLDRASFMTDSSASGSQQSNSMHQFVIGVSANSDYETMQDALSAGVDAFMAKPFSIETFYDTYEKMKAHKK